MIFRSQQEDKLRPICFTQQPPLRHRRGPVRYQKHGPVLPYCTNLQISSSQPLQALCAMLFIEAGTANPPLQQTFRRNKICFWCLNKRPQIVFYLLARLNTRAPSAGRHANHHCKARRPWRPVRRMRLRSLVTVVRPNDSAPPTLNVLALSRFLHR